MTTTVIGLPSDEWAVRRVHWHGYVHRPGAPQPTARQQRLDRPPHHVMRCPDDVADWLMELSGQYLVEETVLLHHEGTTATTWDTAASSSAWVNDQLAASEAQCVYVRHGSGGGAVLLYAEVVDEASCTGTGGCRRAA